MHGKRLFKGLCNLRETLLSHRSENINTRTNIVKLSFVLSLVFSYVASENSSDFEGKSSIAFFHTGPAFCCRKKKKERQKSVADVQYLRKSFGKLAELCDIAKKATS